MIARIKYLLEQMKVALASILNLPSQHPPLCPIPVEEQQQRHNCRRLPYEDSEF